MIRLTGLDAGSPVGERVKFLDAAERTRPPSSVLLSTCDRVELYADDGRSAPPPLAVAEHLFRVASGLESPLPGESRILGQVKEAYETARAMFPLTKSLHILFQSALHAGKRVRTETSITKGAVSHAQAAGEIIFRKIGEGLIPARPVIAVIGVNRLNRSFLRFLAGKGHRTAFLGNRTYSKARILASEFGCEAFSLNRLRSILAESDVLVSATSAPHLIVHREDIPQTRPMLLVDLAVPRDVDPATGDLPGIELFGIERIEEAVSSTHRMRGEEVRKASRIIGEELKGLWNRYHRSSSFPVSSRYSSAIRPDPELIRPSYPFERTIHP